MKILEEKFYSHDNVLLIAKQLIGKIIQTQIDGEVTHGRIVETEAYRHFADKASHASGGKRTARNEQMYGAGGTLYMYICYGLHQMVNVVCNKENIPDAVLIRAIEPLIGLSVMISRTGKTITNKTIGRGPGNVAKALGLHVQHGGENICNSATINIYDDGEIVSDNNISISQRIGVEGAGEDAALPFRFYLKGSKHVSGKRNPEK